MRSPPVEKPPPSVIIAMIAKRLTTNRPQRIAPITKIHARELLFITDNRFRESPARSAFQDGSRIDDRRSKVANSASSTLDLRSSILTVQIHFFDSSSPTPAAPELKSATSKSLAMP